MRLLVRSNVIEVLLRFSWIIANAPDISKSEKVGGQAVLGRQNILPTPWLTERHGYDPTFPYLHSSIDQRLLTLET